MWSGLINQQQSGGSVVPMCVLNHYCVLGNVYHCCTQQIVQLVYWKTLLVCLTETVTQFATLTSSPVPFFNKVMILMQDWMYFDNHFQGVLFLSSRNSRNIDFIGQIPDPQNYREKFEYYLFSTVKGNLLVCFSPVFEILRDLLSLQEEVWSSM